MPIRTLVLYGIVIGMLISSCFIGSATPWVATTLQNVSYVEQEGWKVLDTDVTVSSTTDDFTEGYLIVNVTENASGYDSFKIVSNGSLNISGDAVYWDVNRIGTIDSTDNGLNGTLKIDFTSSVSLPNSGFETGNLLQWIVNDSYTGVTGQEWVESPFDDSDVVTGPGSNDDPLIDDHSSVSQSATVQTSQVYDGQYALKLTIGGQVTKGFGTAHGPMVTSSTFSADEGDNLSVRWYAKAGGDWYDVYGFIFRDADNDGIWDDGESYQKLFHDVGSDTGGWITTNASISSNVSGSNIRFLFLNGNYDNTGGRAIGSNLYIDGIILQINSTFVANNTIMENVIENLEYSNDDDNPELSKNYTITLKESNYAVDSNTAKILITPVNDAPATPGSFTSPTEGQSKQGGSSMTVSWGSSTDVEGDSVKYDLWYFNGTWTQIGSMLNTNSMSFTLPEDNTVNAMFRVFANDTQDNSSARDVTFVVDSTAPTYTWVEKVLTGSTGETATVTINLTDPSGIDVHNITVDGEEYEMSESSGNYSWNISIPSSESGNASSLITYNCSFTDSLGNEGYTGDVLINVSLLPYANFDATATRGVVPLNVNFTDTSYYASSWYWDFGDGNTSTEQNPVHVFNSGNFTVNLTISSSNGTSSNTLNVRAAPEPEYTVEPEGTQSISKYGEELNFTIESTLMSSFEWLVDGNPISGSGFTVVENSNDSSTGSYCLINTSQYINDSDFFMGTYNISVVANNASIQRDDTNSWEWTVTDSSTADYGDDISLVVNGSVNITSSGNESYVRVNATDNENVDENGLNCSIVFVEFNTTEDPSGVLLKVEVVNKTSINESEAGFSYEDVYQYIDIGFSNETLVNNDSYSRNIEFRVLDELNGGSLVINSVSLKHLKTGVWETYTPDLLSSDGTYSYFIVYNVSGFSPFAIMADYSSTSSSSRSSSSTGSGMIDYLNKLLVGSDESEEVAEVVEEIANAESSFENENDGIGDTDTYQATSSVSEDSIDEDNGGNSGIMMFSGIILLALMLFLFIWKRRKDEEEQQ